MGRIGSQRSRGAAVIGWVSSWVMCACGCSHGPSMHTEQFMLEAGRETRVGSACLSVEEGSGLGGGRVPGVPGAAGEGPDESSFSFSYEGTGSGVRLTV